MKWLARFSMKITTKVTFDHFLGCHTIFEHYCIALAIFLFINFLMFLLFQRNLYVVLACGKGPEKAFIETFKRQKKS